jgi:uroporphyrinogen decarboxylase
MNSRERVLKTLDMEEPDRVPLTELDVDVPLMEEISGESFPAAVSLQTPVIADRAMEARRVDIKLKCYRRVGFDLFPIDLSTPENWRPTQDANGNMVDLWGRVMKLDTITRAWVPYSTVFNSIEDYENFAFPDANASGWVYALERAKEKIDGELGLASFIRDPFAHAWEILTPMRFVLWMRRDQGFVRRVIEDVTKFNIGIIRRIAEIGVDLIISGGDYCDAKGPMVPTDFFREVIFPSLKRQVDAAHRAGIRFIKHTDGNVDRLLGDFAKTVDGLHSLDPSAGVDIGSVKEKYGDKLILIGNISVDNLARRTGAEVVDEVKSCIRKASPGGGHILSSSNSWAAGVKLENCFAMVEAARAYGMYPIKVQP